MHSSRAGEVDTYLRYVSGIGGESGGSPFYFSSIFTDRMQSYQEDGPFDGTQGKRAGDDEKRADMCGRRHLRRRQILPQECGVRRLLYRAFARYGVSPSVRLRQTRLGASRAASAAVGCRGNSIAASRAANAALGYHDRQRGGMGGSMEEEATKAGKASGGNFCLIGTFNG